MKTLIKISIRVLGLLGFLSSFSAYAEGGYNIGWNKAEPNAFFVNQMIGTATVDVLKNASLNFYVDKLSSKANSYSFGVYTFDANKNITSTQVFSDLNAGTGFSVDLKAGDQVAFWLEIDGNKTIDSIARSGGLSISLTQGILDLNYSSFAWADTKIKVSGSAAFEPSGQPLPGIIATILVALGLGIFLFRKKLISSKKN